MKHLSIRNYISLTAAVIICLCTAVHVYAQESVKATNSRLEPTQQRPIPYPVILPPSFRKAITKGTRTLSGAPGKNYWMNTARYKIDATLSPESQTLRGRESVIYVNHSPDTLKQIVVNLRQNFYKKGVIRNRFAPITGGMHLDEVMVGKTPMLENDNMPGYIIDGTVMIINLDNPLVPKDSVSLHFGWEFKVPPSKPYAYRMGQDNDVYFLGYWYPQIAVYDDVNGWDTDPYMGNGEFYMDYSDYDVKITVPQGWIVAATGSLVNASNVLTKLEHDRLEKAFKSDSTIHIIGPNERQPGISTQTSLSGELTWHFKVNKVRDFAFGTSASYLWDATSIRLGGKTVMVSTYYRPGSKGWNKSAQYARFTIQDMSQKFTTYPWPVMSVMEGVIHGGMEYPMITLIGSYGNPRRVFGTIYHETAHMWFPMLVGTNEKAYAWMDEGFTTFNTNEGEASYWPDAHPWNTRRNDYYYMIAGTQKDIPPMRPSDQYPINGASRVIASYVKPALMLHALEGILGKDTFRKAFKVYTKQWEYKHPYPYDFFNTVDSVSGRNLGWFWSSMLYTNWTLDQSIDSVKVTPDGATVTVRDLGLTPMPVFLQATYANGMTSEQTIPVDIWLEGSRTATATFGNGKVVRVEIDPHHYLPDINRANNVWTAKQDSIKTGTGK